MDHVIPRETDHHNDLPKTAYNIYRDRQYREEVCWFNVMSFQRSLAFVYGGSLQPVPVDVRRARCGPR